MPGVFGYPDWLRRGVTIAVRTGAQVSTMAPELLFGPQPGLRARFVPTAGAVTLDFDFGALRPIGLVALVNTTMAGVEAVRCVLNASDPTFSAANLLDVSSTAEGADRTRGACIVLASGADVTARHLRLEITGIAAGVLDVGAVMAMATLRLQRGHDFGAREGRSYTGVSDANPFTGAEFRAAGIVNPRRVEFSLPTVLASEFEGSLRAMLDDVTPADDVAWLPEAGLAQGERNRRAVIGALARPGEGLDLTRVSPRTARAQFSVRERV